jgi:hypothetical protein
MQPQHSLKPLPLCGFKRQICGREAQLGRSHQDPIAL